MANPSVTYTFVNGNVADAAQVNQNFTDLINGLTDGTKSLNIDAITAAGTATFNGNTVIGNAAGDTASVNATATFNTTPKSDTVDEKTSTNGVQIKGRSSGSAISAGYIGEVIVNDRTSALTSLVANTYFSIDTGNTSFNDGNETGVTLSAGIWDLQGQAQFLCGSSVTLSYMSAGVGTAKGNDATGMFITRNQSELGITTVAGSSATITTPVWRVNISSQTTYYLKGIFLFGTGASATARGSIVARRVA
jgi:hypothetical protein